MSTWVGNDLMDLAAPHNRGRVAQPRFLKRVLCAMEREQLADEAGDDTAFALLWSAKEAAYKAYQKACPNLVFAPGRWQVQRSTLHLGIGVGNGDVRMDDGEYLKVRWQRSRDWLHCVAVSGPAPAAWDSAVCTLEQSAPRHPFSVNEQAGFSRTESGHVRTLARRLLATHNIHNIEILRETHGNARLPPRVFAAGVPLTQVDLSLSHDGNFVAAAIYLHASMSP